MNGTVDFLDLTYLRPALLFTLNPLKINLEQSGERHYSDAFDFPPTQREADTTLETKIIDIKESLSMTRNNLLTLISAYNLRT